MILRAAKKVRELQAAGKLAPTFVDQELEDAVKRFNDNVERLADRKRNDEPVHSEDALAELERNWNGNEAA